MGNQYQHDMAGIDLIVNNLRVGATTPGQTGDVLEGSDITSLMDVTAGTVTAEKAVVVDASAEITGFVSVTSTDFVGDLTGNVTGNVTGDLTGAVDATTIAATGAVTVGVDDTGADVTFYGATTGKSLLWDESADTLIVTGNVTVSDALRVPSSDDDVHDTTPTQAQMVTALGAAAAGKVGTIDDASGDTVGYFCFSSDTSWYFIAGTKGA